MITIEFFITLQNTVTFSQAAKQLLNNQPNMTRAIKNLEASSGVHCFCAQTAA